MLFKELPYSPVSLNVHSIDVDGANCGRGFQGRGCFGWWSGSESKFLTEFLCHFLFMHWVVGEFIYNFFGVNPDSTSPSPFGFGTFDFYVIS